MRRAALVAMTLLGPLGCGANSGRASGQNACDADRDCPDGAHCSDDFGLCESTQTAASYDLVLQVSELSASASNLERYTFPPTPLSAGNPALDLAVPTGVPTIGAIRRRVGESFEAVPAEVSFTPDPAQTGFNVAPVVMTSRSVFGEGGVDNLRGTLAPGRLYDVTIYPLGPASETLPPVHTQYRSTEGTGFTYTFEELEELSGVLVDEAGTPQADRWLRIHAGAPRGVLEKDPYDVHDVVSSLAIVQADGSFRLAVQPGVLGVRDYWVEVSLFDDAPWTSTIEVDAKRIEAAPDKGIVIPVVPPQVRVSGKVEARLLKAAAGADLTFVSGFPVPEYPGAVNDRDWCKSHRLGDDGPDYRCASSVSVTTSRDGGFTAPLLPGNYTLYMVPSRETENSKRTLTTAREAIIESRPGGGPQTGQLYVFENALTAEGTVYGLGGPLDNAFVRMIPLSGPTNRAIAPYNRPSEGISDARGRFDLPIDRGYFDLLVQPPEDAGYAWLCKANRVINDNLVIGAFSLPPPLLVGGTVSAGGEVVPGARVEAYALVRDLRSSKGERRGMRIGSTYADENGRYLLKLPTSIADEGD